MTAARTSSESCRATFDRSARSTCADSSSGIVDVIHVIGYLWKAAGVFFGSDDPNDPGGHDWLRAILAGRAREVATGIRRSATTNDLRGSGRQTIDEVARYLDAKAPYLDYPTALAEGYPIATGVIEGACRHLVMDRFEVSGARWGLEGAEAVLGLRAVITNRDFDAYWQFYLHQERHRKRVRDRVRLAGDVEAASAAIIRRHAALRMSMLYSTTALSSSRAA